MDAATASPQQATANIITIGHVAHGKSSLLHALTGVRTGKHRDEKVRNMTIRLGHANAALFRCPNCTPPACYAPQPAGRAEPPECAECGSARRFVKKVAFVDAPGHAKYFPAVLAGLPNVDGALLLVAANEACPMPQTAEHVEAVAALAPRLLGSLIVCQTKVDLCTHERAVAHKAEIDAFLATFGVRAAPVVPVCANLGHNVDAVCARLCELPEATRDLEAVPRLAVVRSFDVNKPGTAVAQIAGGVVGGNLIRGRVRPGDALEIRPGLVRRVGAALSVTPIRTRVVSIRSETAELPVALPGMIALQLAVDPFLTKEDRMVGHLLGPPGTLPPVTRRVRARFLRGGDRFGDGGAATRVLVCCGAMKTPGRLVVGRETAQCLELRFELPLCADVGDTVAISRPAPGGTWRFAAAAHIVALVPHNFEQG